MLAGIVFQLGEYYKPITCLCLIIPVLVALSIYSCIAVEYFVRYIKDIPLPSRRDNSEYSQNPKTVLTPKLKYMSIALAFNTTCLFIRYALVMYTHSARFAYISIVPFTAQLNWQTDGMGGLFRPRFTSVSSSFPIILITSY